MRNRILAANQDKLKRTGDDTYFMEQIIDAQLPDPLVTDFPGRFDFIVDHGGGLVEELSITDTRGKHSPVEGDPGIWQETKTFSWKIERRSGEETQTIQVKPGSGIREYHDDGKQLLSMEVITSGMGEERSVSIEYNESYDQSWDSARVTDSAKVNGKHEKGLVVVGRKDDKFYLQDNRYNDLSPRTKLDALKNKLYGKLGIPRGVALTYNPKELFETTTKVVRGLEHHRG